MKDSLKETLTSLGIAAPIVGITVASLTEPEQTANTTGNTTISSFDKVSTSVNSSQNSSIDAVGEDLGKDSTISTAACALIGGITATPIVYEVRTKNNVNYDIIEKRANKIYDKYHKNHVPSSQRGKGIIIADNPDTAEICHEMFNTTFVDREHLILNIISLLLALEEIVNEDNIPSNTKVKLEETINLLRDIKAAYTEKKIIRLSTKDDEALSFILNCFKEHQENKKNNAKKLIKEKNN